MTDTSTCHGCGKAALTPFYRVDAVPVNSCLLLDDRYAAQTYPRADLRLAICECGFVTNTAFDPALTTYSQDYEETQGFSPRFRAYMSELAAEWTDHYDLRGKTVIEIGCGKGEFLQEMLRAGVAHGVGIDPGLDLSRTDSEFTARTTWVTGLFPDDMPALDCDAVICRHTLEHIHPVGEWLRSIRAAIGSRTDTVVLFEVPDVQRILESGAFWDIYYEHCSYFSAGSLEAVFRNSGFDVLRVRRTYDDQYLVLEARPAEPAWGVVAHDRDQLHSAAGKFAAAQSTMAERWRGRVANVAEDGGRTVLWGASSKAVGFLAALGDQADKVVAAVDINPRKHDHYLAGGGHAVVAPKALVEIQPELVIAMNPIYLDEIAADLDSLGLESTLEAV